VLCLIAQQPRITARKIAATAGITEKAELPLRHEMHEGKVLGWVKQRKEVKSAAI